jgi:hypothetical protein
MSVSLGRDGGASMDYGLAVQVLLQQENRRGGERNVLRLALPIAHRTEQSVVRMGLPIVRN